MSVTKKFPANGIAANTVNAAKILIGGRQQEQPLIRPGRNDVFFQQQFQAVGNGLKQIPMAPRASVPTAPA